MQTLAVKCWSGKLRELPYAEFDKKRLELSEAPGVNVLARHGKPQSQVFAADEIKPDTELPIEEIGFGYTISFKVEGAAEQKGTELFRSPHAVLYLADPQSGLLGYSYEGYLNKFNYRIPQGQSVEIKIQGDNKSTRLYVNGRLHQELDRMTLYVMKPAEKHSFHTEGVIFTPEVYSPATKMYYNRTLVFPLKKAGNFKSKITDFKVYNYQN